MLHPHFLCNHILSHAIFFFCEMESPIIGWTFIGISVFVCGRVACGVKRSAPSALFLYDFSGVVYELLVITSDTVLIKEHFGLI